MTDVARSPKYWEALVARLARPNVKEAARSTRARAPPRKTTVRLPGSPEERHPSLDAKIVGALDHLGEALHVLARRVAENHDLSPTQLRVLTRLYAGPPPIAETGALAHELGVADPTISDALATLRKKGLVERERHAHDRRRYQLRLTDAGKQVAAGVHRWTAPAEVATAGVERRDGEHLLTTLLCVIERFQTGGLINNARACTTCGHFFPATPGDEPATHRCAYFDYALTPSDLRVDCAEHVAR